MLKLAFIFLTSTYVWHETYWRDFFKGHEDNYSIYVHAQHGMPEHTWFKQYTVPYTVESTWARTMVMQIAMLKEALQDPENEFFIYCSYNTLPLQSFDFIYNELTKTGQSMFWYDKNPHLNPNDPYHNSRVIAPIPEEHQYKNAQWIILTREHAQMMVDDTGIITLVTHYPSDQEHYPATFLSLHNELHNVIRKDATLVVWHLSKRPPYIFSDLNNNHEFQLLGDAIIHGSFFVRKIDEQCKNLDRLDSLLAYRTVS